ncbi:MAG: hypothetical protein KAT29_10985 [Anaerolineales bacterium]|nr:hypothetical protein [Anaerolineales bacterium]
MEAEIRSGVLLIDENHTINLLGETGTDTVITFDFPEKFETGTWSNWDHGIPQNVSDYKFIYKFRAENEEKAHSKAWIKLENIVALLSFLSSAPVTIKSHGSITNALQMHLMNQLSGINTQQYL